MFARILLLAGLIAALPGFVVPASAQSQAVWSDVRCDLAELSFAGHGFRCRQTNEYRYGDSSVKGHSAAVMGEVNGFSMNVSLIVKDGGFSVYPMHESEALTRKYIAALQPPAQNIGPYRPAANGGYLTFVRDNKACIAFDNPSRKSSNGTAVMYIVRGYFCATQAFANPANEVDALLASLRVTGIGQGKNPFGEAVRQHYRFPPATNAAAPKPGTPATAASANQTEADLAAAKSLYEKNLITREEYDAKRKSILNRL